MERMSVDEILSHLDRMYPDAHCELNHAMPMKWQLRLFFRHRQQMLL